jgi:hypothetical protein
MAHVQQQYAGSRALSVTVRNGRLDKVTTWEPGQSGSTVRMAVTPEVKVK